LLLKVWGEIADSHDYPELARPKTLTILCKQGNIVLSGHSLFAMKKKIDSKRNLVKYTIPMLFTRRVERVYEYVEPLMKENCDPKSLKTLKT